MSRRSTVFVKIMSAAVLLLACSLGAMAAPLEFESLDNTYHTFTIRMAVDKLCAAEDSQYANDYQAGRYWDCISAVVDQMVGLLHGFRENAVGHDPAEKFIFTHSGHEWDYWRKYVKLAMAARELGFDKVLQPDVQSTLQQIQSAFLPYLKPGITDQVLGIEQPDDTH